MTNRPILMTCADIIGISFLSFNLNSKIIKIEDEDIIYIIHNMYIYYYKLMFLFKPTIEEIINFQVY